MSSTILAIESSCDDTGAAIIKNGQVLSNVVANQEVHQLYGGVVPELASRAHQQNIIPVVNRALEAANVNKTELSAVAFTKGPGLLGALLVGTSFAKSFAQSLNIPLIEVNHMEAHIMAHFIDDPKPDFPFLCLTVSGGHTQLVIVQSPLDMEVVGETIDDAVGEAFDKAAKMLGLPYPGGPLIDKNAQLGNEEAFTFSETTVPDLSYSFSGIKTSILYFLRDNVKKNPEFISENMNDICASIQKSLIDMLFKKLIKAANQYEIKIIAIAGGVSANSGLRARLEEEGLKRNWKVYIPKFEYCTDNAAMIAMAGFFKNEKEEYVDQRVTPEPRLKI